MPSHAVSALEEAPVKRRTGYLIIAELLTVLEWGCCGLLRLACLDGMVGRHFETRAIDPPCGVGSHVDRECMGSGWLWPARLVR
jgi:hypothetical protein